MRFVYRAVERIPRELEPGIVYHSEEFELGALLCACGCGHRITLLVPDSHQITVAGAFASIHPSIAVCDGPCKSHYVISAGNVEWHPAFSAAQIEGLMKAQIGRHVAQDESVRSWGERAVRAVWRFVDRVKKLFAG